MKNFFFKPLLFACLTTLISFPFESCKKGPGDAAISFRSRKAKMAGEWKVTLMKLNDSSMSTPPGNSSTNTVTEIQFDGQKVTETVSNSNSFAPVTSTYDDAINYSFEKNGNWKSTETKTEILIDTVAREPNFDEYSETETITTTTESSGTWDFTSGVGKIKNKERVLIITTNELETAVHAFAYVPVIPGTVGAAPRANVTEVFTRKYSSSNEVWTLTELKNKSIKATAVYSDAFTKTVDGLQSGVSTNSEGDFSINLETK